MGRSEQEIETDFIKDVEKSYEIAFGQERGEHETPGWLSPYKLVVEFNIGELLGIREVFYTLSNEDMPNGNSAVMVGCLNLALEDGIEISRGANPKQTGKRVPLPSTPESITVEMLQDAHRALPMIKNHPALVGEVALNDIEMFRERITKSVKNFSTQKQTPRHTRMITE